MITNGRLNAFATGLMVQLFLTDITTGHPYEAIVSLVLAKRLLIAVLMMAGYAMGQDSTTKPLTLSDGGTMAATQLVIGAFVDENPKWEPMVTIDLKTATVKFGKNYKPDEASEKFWQELAGDSPTALKRRIAELEAEVAELRRKK